MALKIRFQMPTGKHPWATLLLRIGLGTIAACVLVFFAVFGYFYVKYQHVVNDRLKQPIFANTAKIYAAPREVRPGQKLSISLIANELREAGYSAESAAQASEMGTYKQGVQTIDVHPGPQSYHAQDGAVIRVSAGVPESRLAHGLRAQHSATTMGTDDWTFLLTDTLKWTWPTLPFRGRRRSTSLSASTAEYR